MSEAHPLPRDGDTVKVVVYLGWLAEQYGFAEVRVWPNRTGAFFVQSATDEALNAMEYAATLQAQVARRQAELDVLREAAQLVVDAMTRSSDAYTRVPNALIVNLQATLEASRDGNDQNMDTARNRD